MIKEDNLNWRYCIIANIKRQYSDGINPVQYGCNYFPGGRKVYLSNRLWITDNEVTVMGLNRFKSRYVLKKVSLKILENIRCKRVYKPRVLELMNDTETKDMWRGNAAKDQKLAEYFASQCSSVRHFWNTIGRESDIELLVSKLDRVPGSYFGFVAGVVTYARKKPERLRTVLEFLASSDELSTSDIVRFISNQPDFFEDMVSQEIGDVE